MELYDWLIWVLITFIGSTGTIGGFDEQWARKFSFINKFSYRSNIFKFFFPILFTKRENRNIISKYYFWTGIISYVGVIISVVLLLVGVNTESVSLYNIAIIYAIIFLSTQLLTLIGVIVQYDMFDREEKIIAGNRIIDALPAPNDITLENADDIKHIRELEHVFFPKRIVRKLTNYEKYKACEARYNQLIINQIDEATNKNFGSEISSNVKVAPPILEAKNNNKTLSDTTTTKTPTPTGSWICAYCGEQNTPWATACKKCRRTKKEKEE